jgi:branched-chain amino acid aminotransferase
MFLQKSDYVWINDGFVAWEEAKVHIMTHALHYSSTVFEGIRSYNGQIFEAESHAKRLINSAKLLEMEIKYDYTQIVQLLDDTVKKNNLSDSYIRPLIWRGDEEMKLYSDKLSTNFLIAAWPISSGKSASLNIDISRWKKFSPETFPTNCKAGATYSMMSKVKIESLRNGFDDSLLLDIDGNIAECTCANIFFVKDNTLYTPNITHILNGITRQTIIDLAKNLNCNVIEKNIHPNELDNFQECFITGTAVEIIPISTITRNDNKISFNESTITDILMNNYHDLVRKK